MIEATVNKTSKAINRREFLYYLFGASVAALAAGTCGVASWATIPHRPSGPRGGLFLFTPLQLPAIQDTPVFFSYVGQPTAPNIVARFWLTNTLQGLLVLQQACTFRGCLYKWQPNGESNHPFPHFVCPCCGSQFSGDGTYVEGPAPRNLDQFGIEVTMPSGIRRTPADGGPIDIQGATQIVVDVENKILGKPRPKPTATPSR